MKRKMVIYRKYNNRLLRRIDQRAYVSGEDILEQIKRGNEVLVTRKGEDITCEAILSALLTLQRDSFGPIVKLSWLYDVVRNSQRNQKRKHFMPGWLGAGYGRKD